MHLLEGLGVFVFVTLRKYSTMEFQTDEMSLLIASIIITYVYKHGNFVMICFHL